MQTRILCIDDEPSILQVYKDILTPQSDPDTLKIHNLLSGKDIRAAGSAPPEYVVDACTKGKDGFSAVEATLKNGDLFSVIFIDVRMPGWDGVKTAKEIRKIDQTAQMVMVTAFADYTLSQMTAEIGMPEKLLLLKKPFDPDEITQMAVVLGHKWRLERLGLSGADVAKALHELLASEMTAEQRENLQLIQKRIDAIQKNAVIT